MATCRQTVNLALRKLGRLAAGREPRQADAQDALDALRSLYTAWIVGGAFGRLRDVCPTGGEYVASGNERVFRTSSSTFTVKLPEVIGNGYQSTYLPLVTQVEDGTTVTVDYNINQSHYTSVIIDDQGEFVVIDLADGGSSLNCCTPPRDGAPVVVSDSVCGNTLSFLYDGSIKKWQGVDSLDLDSEAPRSVMDPQGLASCLAVEISDQFGVDPPAATQLQAARFKMAMTSRFSMPRSQAVGVYA